MILFFAGEDRKLKWTHLSMPTIIGKPHFFWRGPYNVTHSLNRQLEHGSGLFSSEWPKIPTILELLCDKDTVGFSRLWLLEMDRGAFDPINFCIKMPKSRLLSVFVSYIQNNWGLLVSGFGKIKDLSRLKFDPSLCGTLLSDKDIFQGFTKRSMLVILTCKTHKKKSFSLVLAFDKGYSTPFPSSLLHFLQNISIHFFKAFRI